MYKKILVPTDGSEFAKKAQKHALFLAEISGAEIIAISVTENNFVNGLPLDDEVYQLNQILKERSEENLKEFDKLNENDLKITHIVREGSPAKVILEVAKEENIDLIVIGSSGKSGFDRFIMGSVADKVVNSAKCAVLVIH
ncbi:Nucleotide-binding universal stress protein, UspA family [Methanobrevibacter gottschalkii]|uniref:Nucleotide-binding universal stress UspA family protein n=2 Tax=Methanobrevibacter gottschalkii TaxID=190974 RepID=A0A3N5AZR2_9EURY|nr:MULTISPECIES: universal stress protein [Methanobrevibacter]MCQ2970522.1 universal stress protein [archaeon]OEC99574.1 universal stress protein UspA [Methanobrevibacter sp. A27]RPF50497.1 nucleotide-binding universal stress UspA family protein [Methanobrevibacter gottschalkii DSM 11977]SEK88294.1 Nucleotide-binding universal stress protein, UspA family [Methanobrevibacter gottschalkii]